MQSTKSAPLIPSMGGAEIGNCLFHYARNAPKGTAIVELGAWLGAGTFYLASGAAESGCTVHSFDRFQARGQEIEKAARFGVQLIHGQDTFPIFKKNISRFERYVFPHKGQIQNAQWNGNPISVYVDDACKRRTAFLQALKTFSPSWIPGVTVLVLQDYLWSLRHPNEPDAQIQRETVEGNPGSFTELQRWPDLCAVAFRFEGWK